MSVEGALNLPVIIITYSKCCILQQTFMMIKIDLVYNVILGRSFFWHKINTVINTIYLIMKFPINKRVVMVKENQLVFRICI